MWDTYLSLAVEKPALFWLIFAIAASSLAILLGQVVPWLTQLLLRRVLKEDAKTFYSLIVEPHRSLLTWTGALAVLDLVALWLLQGLWYVPWYPTLEFGITLGLTVSLGTFLFRCFQTYFDEYLLDAALQEGRKTNSELLLVGRFLAIAGLLLILVTLFAQTHQINIIGVFASLGVGGIAVAFSAQKVLEQLLGGVVIYVDRPFAVDDYIGLPDGTFGRVEAIGLRSTKIRTSGKGTLAIVPNSALIQATVENFTGAKKGDGDRLPQPLSDGGGKMNRPSFARSSLRAPKIFLASIPAAPISPFARWIAAILPRCRRPFSFWGRLAARWRFGGRC